MSEEKYVWLNRGQNFSKTENNFVVLHGELPKGIYRPICDSFGNWSLECLSDEFTFDYKIYDMEEEFITHVMKTWNNTTHNLGIMLNGIKGTGKTVTGKLIANKTNLPVILVECSESGDPTPLVNYLKTIDFDCVFFFDEYEKGFKDGNAVLTLMDGMYSDLSRKMFILTTNNRWVNDNLIARPSRIRYFLQFNDIPAKALISYLDDNLIDKSRKQEIIKFVDQLRDCTIDIVKAIVDEINLHGCSIDTVQKYMNLTKETYNYTYYQMERGDNNIMTLSQFIEHCAKLGTAGESRYGNHTDYLTINDLGLYRRSTNFSKKFSELKEDDFMDDDDELKIVKIDGDYLECIDEYNNTYFYKVLNTGYTPSLYGNALSYIY